MSDRTFHFDFNNLKLAVPQIERVMGYKDDENRELVTGLIGEILNESKQICNVKAQYKTFPEAKFDKDSKSVQIGDTIFEIKKIVYSQIRKSNTVAIFVCTAGAEIGIRSRKAMQDGDLVRGYVYDVIGSEIVEAAADLMQTELEKEVNAAGMKITNRYSPGYCGWDVAEQHKLFKLIPDNYCGIRLTESALMDPVKSISGIIGIGSDVKLNPYICGMCDFKDCYYRKLRE